MHITSFVLAVVFLTLYLGPLLLLDLAIWQSSNFSHHSQIMEALPGYVARHTSNLGLLLRLITGLLVGADFVSSARAAGKTRVFNWILLSYLIVALIAAWGSSWALEAKLQVLDQDYAGAGTSLVSWLSEVGRELLLLCATVVGIKSGAKLGRS